MTALLDFTFVVMSIVIVALARIGLVLIVLAALALPVIGAMGAWPYLVRLYHRARDHASVEGLDWRSRVYYAPSHTWLRRRLRQVTVGVDALVARLVPWVRSVSLPRPGTVVHRGEVVAEIAWGERRAPIVSPVEGRVLRVNAAVARDPGLALRDPYGRGWLFTVEPAADWPRGLRHGGPARVWFALEAQRLSRVFEEELGLAAADGGHLLAPGPGLVSDEQWRRLSREFLLSA
jgi:glycine cleavage system H protein